jgi:hypothetical protein
MGRYRVDSVQEGKMGLATVCKSKFAILTSQRRASQDLGEKPYAKEFLAWLGLAWLC